MKFLVDMPLSPNLAKWLCQQGHDALHASQIGLSSSPDTEILKIEETGLILFRGANYNEGECIERLERVFELTPNQNLYKSVVVIEKGRIRSRNLPI
jgi:hypothetical protein